MRSDAHLGTSPQPGARVRARSGGGSQRRASSRSRTSWTIAAFAVFAAICIARFVTAGDGGAPDVVAAPRPTLEATIARLEATVAATPDDARSLQQLGAAYVQKLVQSTDPAYADLARRALDRATALAPDATATLVTRAELALTLHQFADAAAVATRVRTLAPSSNDALVVLADAAIELGRYDEAAAVLQELLDRKPGVAALARVSYLRELYGDIEGALTALRQAETAATSASSFDRATIAAIRGDLLFNHGRVDDAAAAYDAALAEEPQQLVAIAGRARVLVARGAVAEAAALLVPIVERFPSVTLLTLQADIATLDGRDADAASARALVRATIDLERAGGAAIDLEAAQFEADHGGDPATVLDLATSARAARPGVHGADVLAWARHRAGDHAGAAALIEDALRLGTRDASILFHAAAIHATTGDVARAATELRDALTINPNVTIAGRAEVAELAGRLGVAVPDHWGRR